MNESKVMPTSAKLPGQIQVRRVWLLDPSYNIFYKVCDQDGFAFDQMHTSTKKDHNWHAWYFQPSVRQALGYASDKMNPSGVCTLVCFQWLPAADSIAAYDLSDAMFGDSKIDGVTKASVAKSMLGLPAECDLMPTLGGVLNLLETDSDKEVVISHQCFTPQYVRPRVMAQLKFMTNTPFISHWRLAGEEWRRCDLSESNDPTKLARLIE